MKTEIWDVLDENGFTTGKTVARGRCFLKPGEYHLVVHIWVVTPDGKLLIQRRSDQKKLMPGEWAATGGAAISGEESFVAAQRELYEELGISSTRSNLKNVLRLKRRNSLLDIWMITLDVEPQKLTLQQNEVAEVRLATVDELKGMIENGLFHNYGKEYFEKVLSALEAHKGAIV